jgi:UDP-N-acetylmuramate--alanine ligase
VYYDYAHHPTEIQKSISAVRAAYEGKITVIFSPHTYSRTAALFHDFVSCFSEADEIVLLDIYAARERNESGVNAKALADAIANAVYMPDLSAAVAHLAECCRPGDLLVVMGAGDVFQLFAL